MMGQGGLPQRSHRPHSSHCSSSSFTMPRPLPPASSGFVTAKEEGRDTLDSSPLPPSGSSCAFTLGDQSKFTSNSARSDTSMASLSSNDEVPAWFREASSGTELSVSVGGPGAPVFSGSGWFGTKRIDSLNNRIDAFNSGSENSLFSISTGGSSRMLDSPSPGVPLPGAKTKVAQTHALFDTSEKISPFSPEQQGPIVPLDEAGTPNWGLISFGE